MKLYISGAQLFCDEAGRIRTEQSRRSFMKIMRYLQREYPHHHLKDFTTDELTTFCLLKVTERDGTVREPAPSTVTKRRAHIRSVFRWFLWKGLIEDDPAADLEWTVEPGSGGVTRLGNWLTATQVAAIYRAFDSTDQLARRDRLVFWFGVLTGLRLFELREITWDSFTPGYEHVKIKGKGNKLALIALPDQLRQSLKEWRFEAPPFAKAVFPSGRPSDRSNWKPRTTTLYWDMPLQDSGLTYAVRRAGELIGLKLAPHDLRRTYAGIMEAQGNGLKDIQLALRHTHLTTTEKYLKKDPARAAQVTAAFGIQII
jgi:integrase